MDKTIFQVPVTVDLRKEAEKEALRQGFSSLQEIVRIFLRRLADRTVAFTFEEVVHLSPRAVKRYNKAIKDIEERKGVFSAKSSEDLMHQLENAPSVH